MWDKKALVRIVGNKIRQEIKKKNPDFEHVSYLSSLVADDIYSWDWYQRFFSTRDAQASQVVGDITPAYSMIPEKGVSYIKESLPNVKIIYIIREPVARAKSQIKMKLSRQAVSNDEEGWKSILKSKEIYSRGDYKAYIPRWKKQFNGSDLLFLPFGLKKVNLRV